MSLIRMRNLHKIYNTGNDPVHALQGATIGISQGEFVAVMGPSGSGKSTLLAVLGGLSQPTQGSVVVDGIDIYALSAEQRADFHREYLGFVFQSFQLIPYLTVVENVMLPLSVTSLSRADKGGRAIDIIEKVGLRSKALRLPDELSGGEQQRVAIARALVNQPPIILADEPTGNLDTATSEGIMELLRKLNGEGHTCIIITHNPENVRHVHRCVHMRDGKLLLDGPVATADDRVTAEVLTKE
ncbi:MAG: ABC transporter ATP-binding protein [Ignavibacteriales bacterium]|nr:ABC transporter ATP-binding protein [Ignavibacteriales bacterium]